MTVDGSIDLLSSCNRELTGAVNGYSVARRLPSMTSTFAFRSGSQLQVRSTVRASPRSPS